MQTRAYDPALLEIAHRIRDMRDILGYSVQKMAELTEVPEETYRQYETGTVDLPFTFLHKCSAAFGVEIEGKIGEQSAFIVEIIFGEE